MADIQLRNIDPDQLHQLEELAAEEGQPVDAFVASLLADILRKRAADREKGIGSRIAKRFENLGLEDGEIEELRGYQVRPPEFEQ